MRRLNSVYLNGGSNIIGIYIHTSSFFPELRLIFGLENGTGSCENEGSIWRPYLGQDLEAGFGGRIWRPDLEAEYSFAFERIKRIG